MSRALGSDDQQELRNRLLTPRGEVEVAHQEIRGRRRSSSWRWFWLARRRGASEWREASTAREAIRRAILLSPGKLPAWLNEAAAEAERELTAAETEDRTTQPRGPSEPPAVHEAE
jgi:hypothetical protein